MRFKSWGIRIGPLGICWLDLWKKEAGGLGLCFELTWKDRILVSLG